MNQTYQRKQRKSKEKRNSVEIGEGIHLPLPLVEVWEQLQASVEELSGQVGKQIMCAILEEEVRQKVGERHHPQKTGQNVRWGRQPGYVVFAGQKVEIQRPRVRTRTGEEVELENYRRLQQDGRMQRAVVERMVCGLSTRKYGRALQSMLTGYGIKKSSVSRHFVQATSAQLRRLCERRLEDLRLVAMFIDGIEFAEQTLVVAVGAEENGKKWVLGLWQGATENATVCKALLEDLVERGLQTDRRYLWVLDGSKALRAAVDKVFGHRAEVQRCHLHKIRNVLDHLPQDRRPDWRRRLQNAYHLSDYRQAREALRKIWRQLSHINPSAARSLEEGMEETLTLHRLGASPLLRRSLNSTNVIESCLSTVRHVCRNVKHWQGGDHILRWTATGLWEAERKFHKINAYWQLAKLGEQLNSQLQAKAQVA